LLRATPGLTFVLLLLAEASLLLAAACSGGGTSPLPVSTLMFLPAGSPPPVLSSSPAVPLASPTASRQVTLVAVGDVMLGRIIGDRVRGFGPPYPFELVADTLRQADVTFANLESPLTEGGEPEPKDFVFQGPPEAARGLAEAGIDIVSVANNHALDYGLWGLAETRAALESAGVAYVGVGDSEAVARSPRIIERNGLRLAFLAYVNTPRDSVSGFDVAGTAATTRRPGVAWATLEVVAADVVAAAAHADIVVVSLHAGLEYQELPSDLQVAVAHAAIDAGARLVLGHHPHVLQGIERYRSGLIIYSLGNFVFDLDSVDYAQPGLPSALSAVLEIGLTREGVVDCRLLPIAIDPADGRPYPASGEQAAAVLERMSRLSDGSCGLGSTPSPLPDR